MRLLIPFLCAATLGLSQATQLTNETGIFNKLCCTSTITSRQIHSSLEDTNSAHSSRRLLPTSKESNVGFGKFSPNSLFVQNSVRTDLDDDKESEQMDQFPSDSLFAPNSPILKKDNYAFWNANVFESSSQKIPNASFHYYIYGMGVGINYLGFESCAIGTGILYDHINLIQDHNLGSQVTQYVLGTFFVSFPIHRFSLNLAATGGGLFSNSKRHVTSPMSAIAKASYISYQFMPHMDMNYDFNISNISFSPFYQIDWATIIRPSFKEYGAGPANLKESSLMASVLRQEIGMNFYEQWDLQEKGLFVFRQKGSYVRLIPFQHSTFDVSSLLFLETIFLLPESQNFGSWAFEVRYQSKRNNLILTFEGFYGDGFVNDAAYLTYLYNF